MRPYRGLLGLGALALLAATAGPAGAAWNNVFQVTCCNSRPRAAMYVAPVVVQASPACCNPCPQPVCTTQYIQRCYYQPVTVMQTKTYYEPVTTYRTSYYYEPVTSYRYSCYYDPCTCRYQQVAQPVTSYALRSQCCPVQSWVQRCCSVPVTVMQQRSYYEPVTTCSTPCSPCNPCAQAAVAVPQQQPVVQVPNNQVPNNQVPNNQVPINDYYRSPNGGTTLQPPIIKEQQGSQSYKRDWGTEPPLANPGPGTSLKQPAPYTPPAVKLERIAFATDAAVQGQVVNNGTQAPRAGAQVVFVHASQQGKMQSVTANAAGHFQADLAPGGYLVYVNDNQGLPVFHSRIDVDGKRPAVIKLVSR